MAFQVPFVDPRKHYRSLKPLIDSAIEDCLSNGDLIDRHHLREFEEHLAAYVGVKFAIGVSSGYHALELTLRAADIGPGDQVITVAHTFLATISAIVNVGARPVLVDVSGDYNMDPAAFEAAITKKTKAVIPVSLNGRSCQMDRILAIANARGIRVIEDAAQALGAAFGQRNCGSFGLAGALSCFPFKLLGGFGDGGVVTTNDTELARKIRLLRYNGEDRKTGEYHFHGVSGLMDNVQSAVLDVKLKFLPKWIEHRRASAGLYREGLQDVDGLQLPHFDETNQRDAFQNYVVRTKDRDCLRAHLTSRGIETLIHWPRPVWQNPGLRLDNPGLPETEKICREVISLPMSAETTADQVEIVTAAIRDFYRVSPLVKASAGRAC
ncbi:MAG TPA: DegT/DnrJ/EryC1/StrS family aminotransferase [Candidatus Acidoferrales bacterium]|nr:DegT/DnrJ/EryC1/StrS family aminotransferase [Candidatus Acidoferrales bacterium]